MQIAKKENYSTITLTEKSVKDFYNSFLKKSDSLQKEHLVLHFSESFNTTAQEILLFLNIAKDYRQNGMSFVIICLGINIDDIPDEINVVPTMTEAIDVLELDSIERDLMNF